MDISVHDPSFKSSKEQNGNISFKKKSRVQDNQKGRHVLEAHQDKQYRKVYHG